LLKCEIAWKILAYLADHPDAQDTLEGIAHWWILERKLRCQLHKVREAVSELVGKGLILECKSRDSKVYYRIAPGQKSKIQALLEKTSGQKKDCQRIDGILRKPQKAPLGRIGAD
jgi:hypothetical protein